MSDKVKEIREQSLQRVIRSYENGESINRIAAKTGVSGPTISKWIKQEGYRKTSKGRYPTAMKYRARDLHQKKWEREDIIKLLRVPDKRLEVWLAPEKNPSILGGEKDPLKIKSGPPKRSKKIRERKRFLSKKDWSGKIPKSHRCRKKWNNEEENKYIFKLIESKISIADIYRHMRASKKIQLKIWKMYGGKGRPPNFPPEQPPPCYPDGTRIPEETKKEKQLKKLKTIAESEASRLQKEYDQIKEQNLALKLAIEKEKEESESRRKALEAWSKRRTMPPPTAPPISPRARRVVPGSYEQVALGLPEGTKVKEPRVARPKRERDIIEWADNRQYFTISNDWADLSDAPEDELDLFADFLTKEGFPARVEASGDQPEAFYKERWPKGIERKWIRATERATDFLEAYSKRKRDLVKENFAPSIASNIMNYLSNAYDAYRNQQLSDAQKEQAKSNMIQAWEACGPIDQAILHFFMKNAELSGAPTKKGVERGLAAKRVMSEDSARLAKRLGKKRERLLEKEEARRLLEARKKQLRGEE